MATGEADAEGAAYVEGSLLTEGVLERRRYQLRLADTAAETHTLVCLPTGLGKTTVSLLVTARRLEAVGGRALLLAPTKPLVRQHADFYREALSIPDDDVVVFTGEVSPDDRADLWGDARVVVATPQVVENDLVGGRVSLASVTHVTFDECHRATGDYAYNYIAERYHRDADRPLVTGMSASPGGDEAAILQVCENLGVETVEVMTEEDADVAEYTHDTDVEWRTVELPAAVLEIRDALNDVVRDRLTRLKELGVCSTTQPDLSQKQLNEVRGRLQELIDNGDSDGFEGMSVHAEVMKLRQAVTLVETQSVEALRRYFERQREAARSSGASKADQRLVSDPSVREAMRRAEAYDALHPKYSRTRRLTAETLGIENGDRVIVFTESRDTAEALTEFLGEHFAVRRFVGQGDRQGSDGMTQRQQQDTLESFRQGEFEVLVSTSVAEEGLDVPEVDLVLFYEPVPTAIRSVQRKGRTGRQTEGRVVVLMAEDTRDEAYFWISRRREEEMEEELRALKEVADEVDAELAQSDLGSFADEDATTTTTTTTNASTGDDAGASDESEPDTPDADRAELTDFAAVAAGESDEEPAGTVASAGAGGGGDGDGDGAEAVEVVVDQRELESSIARDLSLREGVETRLETLAVGDYVVVLLEGEGLYGERDVHPNAIRGALASLAVDFDASVLRTADEDGTADMLATVAEREQTVADREVSVHGEKQSRTLDEQQEYVVSSIADVGPVTARALLAHFGTVEAVMTAREDDLLEVDGVGEVTATRLREVVGSEYDPS
ncbi:Hef nuclease [Halobacteriales archaeon SW_5_70_135]|nr:MAG: Hef nuclease [Halobacteriales archaeon SW_5_70_135]